MRNVRVRNRVGVSLLDCLKKYFDQKFKFLVDKSNYIDNNKNIDLVTDR